MRKIFLAFVTVLWILAGIQMITNLNRENEQKLVEAFSQMNYTEAGTKIEVSGVFEGDYMTTDEQEDFLKEVAGEIGIERNYELIPLQEDNRRELSLYKKADKAVTVIKIVTVEHEVEDNLIQSKQYFLMDFSLPDSVEGAMLYKDIIENALRDYSVRCECNVRFEGCFDGMIDLEERNRITDQLLEDIKAKVVSENRKTDLYTVYAYTQLVNDYQLIEDERVNVNIVMSYDENENVTTICVATPLMPQDF